MWRRGLHGIRLAALLSESASQPTVSRRAGSVLLLMDLAPPIKLEPVLAVAGDDGGGGGASHQLPATSAHGQPEAHRRASTPAVRDTSHSLERSHALRPSSLELTLDLRASSRRISLSRAADWEDQYRFTHYVGVRDAGLPRASLSAATARWPVQGLGRTAARSARARDREVRVASLPA